jgi:GGDEF domain-containing protein
LRTRDDEHQAVAAGKTPSGRFLGLLRSFTAGAGEEATAAPERVARLRRQVEGARRTVLYDGDLGLYQRWYFELRLAEEARRSSRYDLQMAVIVVRLREADADAPEAIREIERVEAAYVTSRSVRNTDLVAVLDTDEFGVALLHCDYQGAVDSMRRLARRLRSYGCTLGLALYPEDATEPRHLIDVARGRLTSLELPDGF